MTVKYLMSELQVEVPRKIIHLNFRALQIADVYKQTQPLFINIDLMCVSLQQNKLTYKR